MLHHYVMLCYVLLCYFMLCYVMICYVMLCYAMLCYVMLCYVMLCYVVYYLQIQYMYYLLGYKLLSEYPEDYNKLRYQKMPCKYITLYCVNTNSFLSTSQLKWETSSTVPLWRVFLALEETICHISESGIYT